VRDLSVDTAVAGRDGHYTATLSAGWDIWGPQGGYVAGVALRAAAAAASFPRPASVACHFLRPAQVGPIEIHVESLRETRRAQSLRVVVVQNDAPILEALVWTVADVVGIDHDAGGRPNVPPPEEVDPWEAYLPGGEVPFPFWRNLDVRPITPPPREWTTATAPRFVVWMRLRVTTGLDDPFVDAARMLVAADSAMYPAATFAHDEPFPYIAPSMDLVMTFHRAGTGSEWVLVDAASPVAEGALVAGRASLWPLSGGLLGTATQQMLQRT
jgi:acyl-CoA thioesterase II